jgi:hypothetical protein
VPVRYIFVCFKTNKARSLFLPKNFEPNNVEKSIEKFRKNYPKKKYFVVL